MWESLKKGFFPKRDVSESCELQINLKDHTGVYLGGGNQNGRGLPDFAHIVFSSKKGANEFCFHLEKYKKTLPDNFKIPRVIEAQAKFHPYAKGSYFVRIHRSSFDKVRKLIKDELMGFSELTEFSNLSKFSPLKSS